MADDISVVVARFDSEANYKLTELKNKLDYQSGMVYAERKGQTKGLKEGLQKGELKGEHKKAIEIAKNLKAAGVSADIIFQTTGLRLED